MISISDMVDSKSHITPTPILTITVEHELHYIIIQIQSLGSQICFKHCRLDSGELIEALSSQVIDSLLFQIQINSA
jgi:hypothetical protein